MRVLEMTEKLGLKISAGKDGTDREISKIYICDLLSFAMSKAPADSAWITVMNNVNVLAVASLADVSCVILCEGVLPDAQAAKKADDMGIPLLLCDLPAFEAALAISNAL
jgi:predicted transcriptional regulator